MTGLFQESEEEYVAGAESEEGAVGNEAEEAIRALEPFKELKLFFKGMRNHWSF